MANTPFLSANHSNNLVKLIRNGSAPIDAIEYTHYTAKNELIEQIPQLTAFKSFYHPGSYIRFLGWQPQFTQLAVEYQKLINPPWVSFHIVLKPGWGVWLAQNNFPVRFKRNQKLEDRFIQKINRIKNLFSCPIMLESMPAAAPGDDREITLDMINTIVKETDALFLLDIPHAMISAQMLDISVETYLAGLPLERTKQIHLSGPRPIKGYLRDAHDTIGDSEKYWLQWVLDHTNPDVVTLEYFRDEKKLAAQLEELAKLMGK